MRYRIKLKNVIKVLNCLYTKKAIFLFWVLPLSIHAQLIVNPSHKNLFKNLFSTSVLITLNDGSTGSGIIVDDSLKMFLVTARHVLFTYDTINKKYKLKTNLINILLYRDDPLKENYITISVQFKDTLDDSIVKFDKNHDISVIFLAARYKESTSMSLVHYLKQVTIDKHTSVGSITNKAVRLYADVTLGDNVYLCGFPTSLALKSMPQFDYTKPLLRKGIVAGKYEKLSSIIIDCPAYWGNSGGPVYEENGEYLNEEMKLIGIVTEFIPAEENNYQKKNSIQYINSGYSIVVPIDYAFELFRKFK